MKLFLWKKTPESVTFKILRDLQKWPEIERRKILDDVAMMALTEPHHIHRNPRKI